jgi:hypothetical protein
VAECALNSVVAQTKLMTSVPVPRPANQCYRCECDSCIECGCPLVPLDNPSRALSTMSSGDHGTPISSMFFVTLVVSAASVLGGLILFKRRSNEEEQLSQATRATPREHVAV